MHCFPNPGNAQCEAEAVAHAKFLEQMINVDPHGFWTELQSIGNPFARLAAQYERCHDDLAGRQPRPIGHGHPFDAREKILSGVRWR